MTAVVHKPDLMLISLIPPITALPLSSIQELNETVVSCAPQAMLPFSIRRCHASRDNLFFIPGGASYLGF